MKGQQPVRIEFPSGRVFDPDKIERGLSDEAKSILERLDKTTFVIEDYLDPPGTSVEESRYENLIMTLIKSLHYGFEHPEFSTHKIKFKYREDSELKTLAFQTFILDLIYWYPYIQIKPLLPEGVPCELTDQMFISEMRAANEEDTKFMKWYFDHFYILPYKKYVARKLNRIFANTIYLIMQFGVNFYKFLGISIGVEEWKRLADKYPRFKELMYLELDANKQPSEIEADIRTASAEQMKIIEEDPGFHALKAIRREIKRKQLEEVQLVIGLKADQDGKTIPYPINTNFITGGLKNVAQQYINNIAGRKAALINDQHMGTSGYMLIQTQKASNSAKLSPTTKDCHTANPVPIVIKTKDHLVKLNGRRYRIGSDRHYHTIDAEKDEWLIGKMVWLRSPVTCACKDGVCAECYGDLYDLNIDLNSAGAYAAMYVMNPCVQMLLSAKHFQETQSHTIKFENPLFNTFFTISSTDIVLNLNMDDIDDYSIMVRQEDFMSTDSELNDPDEYFNDSAKVKKKPKKKASMDDDEESSDDDEGMNDLKYYTKKFYVVKGLHAKGGKGKEVYEFTDAEAKELYMHDDLVARMHFDADVDGNFLYIDFGAIDPQEFVFAVDVANNELTKPVKSIEKLINTKGHEECDTIDAIVQKLLDLLIEAKLDASSVQGEMILYNLIRSSTDILSRPNFRHFVTKKDYEIVTVKDALKYNPSINTSISSAYLRQQLIQMPETFRKNAPSDYDLNFRPYIDEESMGVPVLDVFPDGKI